MTSRVLPRREELYLAVSIFVATSVSIGLVAVVGQRWAVIPVALGWRARRSSSPPASA